MAALDMFLLKPVEGEKETSLWHQGQTVQEPKEQVPTAYIAVARVRRGLNAGPPGEVNNRVSFGDEPSGLLGLKDHRLPGGLRVESRMPEEKRWK
ncbi:unnamed protein product [Nezara viridula]|uniref:Uncharacterized protein n=1 Tax=Nezara viridula TaxID=85310 RepID=A0A9P0HI80_NEZVI|nr:unnamed protein product [Nezara viridula]